MSDTENQSTELTFKEQIVLEQMRQQYAETLATFRALDGKAEAALLVSSVVIAILTGFKLSDVQALKNANLLLPLLSYGATLICAFWVLFPKAISGEPIKANWDEIVNALKETGHNFYYRLLSGYELSILRNREINVRKMWFIRASFTFLAITVISAVLTATG